MKVNMSLDSHYNMMLTSLDNMFTNDFCFSASGDKRFFCDF